MSRRSWLIALLGLTLLRLLAAALLPPAPDEACTRARFSLST